MWLVEDADPTFECVLLRGGPTGAKHLRVQKGIRYTIITERSNVDHEHRKGYGMTSSHTIHMHKKRRNKMSTKARTPGCLSGQAILQYLVLRWGERRGQINVRCDHARSRLGYDIFYNTIQSGRIHRSHGTETFRVFSCVSVCCPSARICHKCSLSISFVWSDCRICAFSILWMSTQQFRAKCWA